MRHKNTCVVHITREDGNRESKPETDHYGVDTVLQTSQERSRDTSELLIVVKEEPTDDSSEYSQQWNNDVNQSSVIKQIPEVTNYTLYNILGTYHLTCRGGLWFFFCSEKILAYLFFSRINIRLYDKNSELDSFYFPPPKSEYFFQQHWESE